MFNPYRFHEFRLEVEETSMGYLPIEGSWGAELEEHDALKHGHQFIGSGGTKCKRGVAIVVNGRWAKSINMIRTVSERLSAVVFRMRGKHCRFIVIYICPTWIALT